MAINPVVTVFGVVLLVAVASVAMRGSRSSALAALGFLLLLVATGAIFGAAVLATGDMDSSWSEPDVTQYFVVAGNPRPRCRHFVHSGIPSAKALARRHHR